ncbi:MAG: family 43 glycosylhydrolase [Bacilli bacterium]|nr:family 43 glycosylhydrolase [Bacilli bacterium]
MKKQLFLIGIASLSMVGTFTSCGVKSSTITYENLKGATANNPTSYTVNDAFTLKDPTDCSYEFTGWLLGGESGEPITEIKKGTTGNLTLWATWNSEVLPLVVDESYRIVADKSTALQDAYQINDALSYYKGYTLPIKDVKEPVGKREIVIDHGRKESESLSKNLEDNGYAIKIEDRKIVIGYTTELSRTCAIDHLLTDYCNEDGLKVPGNLSVTGECKPDKITEITLPEDIPGTFRAIRDPFILKEGDDYYMYGTTNWEGIEWRCYHTTGSFKNEWTLLNHEIVTSSQADVAEQRWAPEMHKYNGKYYMFTTYNSAATGKRGVTVFESSSPDKNFVTISEHPNNTVKPGHITDDSLGCTIDGTLYVDENKQPWLIYVKEWVDCPGEIGRMNIVKLSKNLKTIDGDPVTLFKANDGPWCTKDHITDGCFVHKMKDGSLVMIWSNGSDVPGGYATGMLINREGEAEIDNPNAWVHQNRMLYAKGMYNDEDGGHSMIFEDDGQLYMCQHGSNGNNAHPIIVPIKEAYGTLVWDLYK